MRYGNETKSVFVVGDAVRGGARCGLRQAAGTAGGRGRKGEHVDYVCTSCYRYVNGTSEPVTVEFHSAQYDLTPPPVEEAFTVAVGGRHEVSFAGFGLFPGPFCLGDDTWVKVSQGSGSSCSGRGMSRLFCSIRPHMNGSKETALPACTSIVSRTMILQGRKSSIDK